MNRTPIEAATLAFDAQGAPFSADHQGLASGAEIARTFLVGNDLPARWKGRTCFVVLATRFGCGRAFLATWRAWRDDPSRCDRLVYIAIESRPLSRVDLRAMHGEAGVDAMADALCESWPPLVCNLHSLAFEEGRVRLLLAPGATQVWLPELVAEVDAFYLDGMAGASDVRQCKALGRLAAPGATLAAHAAGPELSSHLRIAGFAHTAAPPGAAFARYAPVFTPRRAPSRLLPARGLEPHVLIVGAGLAGCAAARAFASHGWRSTLFERHPAVAGDASGNPMGLFHGIVNAQDGTHARFNRAAALRVAQEMNLALRDGVPGAMDGLLRLERVLETDAMRRMLTRLRLPTDYVQALGAAEASVLAGIPVAAPAWYYPRGGWVAPAALAAHYLRRAGPCADLRTGIDIRSLSRTAGGWQLVDGQGQVVAAAATVVLANAFDALRLLDRADWPIEPVRGQISLTRHVPFAPPRVPIAGNGYLLPGLDGLAMFGATSQRGDSDPAVRPEDHAFNLAQLERLLGHPVDLVPGVLQGRTAWRCSAADRLPLIGAMPDPGHRAARSDRARFIPRSPGLYVFTGLGSRGIAWSALGAQVLAALATGAPVPLEASLLDAIDPARFARQLAPGSSRGPLSGRMGSR